MNKTLLDQLIREEQPFFRKREGESFYAVVSEERSAIMELETQGSKTEKTTDHSNKVLPLENFVLLSNNFRNYFIVDKRYSNGKRSGESLEFIRKMEEMHPDLIKPLIKGLTRAHRYYEGLIPPEVMQQFNSKLHQAYLIMRQWQSDEALLR